MNSRERVLSTLSFEKVDRAPRQLWTLPGVTLFRNDELKIVKDKFPDDLGSPVYHYGRGKQEKGTKGMVGIWVDEWGCVRESKIPGVAGAIVGCPIDSWAALDSYQPPWEVLDDADFSQINRSCEHADKFMLLSSKAKPFTTMQMIRGMEQLLYDLAYCEKELYRLRDMIHEFNLRSVTMCAETDVDGVQLVDDWGTQISLLISPDLWREFFKPLYKEYCDILLAKGKYIFFHSDGHIEAIYPDLIELGIHALNSQVFCMDMDKLGRQYAGKIVFWGEMDRQHILPFGTEDEVRNAVRRIANTLRYNKSGVIAQCEWGANDPIENILTFFDEWEKI